MIIIFIYLLCVSVRNSSSNFNTDRPYLKVSNGHLLLTAGKHKNITLVTRGQGTITVNGQDLTLITQLAQNATHLLQHYKSNFYDLDSSSQISDVIRGKDVISQRISTLESKVSLLANSSFLTVGRYNSRMAVLRRRISRIRRNVNRLIRLLGTYECSSDPCQNGAKCKDIFNGVICLCNEGWEGPYCEVDINECERFFHTELGCQNGATCTNTPGSYKCDCANGWHGIHCTRRTTDCNSAPSTDLCGHGVCVNDNSPKGYKCICEQGWKTDEVQPSCTTDINECTLDRPSCSFDPLVSCINTPGSYKCGSCPQGYTGNGFYCADVDECAIFNGGCSVSPMVQCINTRGSSRCGACPSGYIGNGFSCFFVGVCHVNNGGCHSLAQCRENSKISSTFVECICPEEFVGSGFGPNGCTRVSPSENPCSSNPCLHGTCVSHSSVQYECRCDGNFEGRNCDLRKDPCQPNPCRNGGSCVIIFNLSYTCNCTSSYTGRFCEEQRQDCGGRFTNMVGVIEYPPSGFSSSALQKTNCAWIIETNASLALEITITKFNVEGSRNCRIDWLQVYDGTSEESKRLGRFCGNNLPEHGSVKTTNNVAYLIFQGNHSSNNFKLSWKSVEPDCNEIINVESHGVLKSRPLRDENRDCLWILKAPLGKRIEFHFYKLNLRHAENCTGDYLEFLDNSESQKKLISKYCKTSLPEPLISFGPEVNVHYHVDKQSTDSEFQISYTAVEGLPGCGGVFTADKGEISSPVIDGVYPSLLVCEYRIISEIGTTIKLKFLKFELEEVDDCGYDYLKIHEGGNSKAPLIGTYCGSKIPPSYTSLGNELFIVFRSDWGNEFKGFQIKYETVCGGKFTESSGVITSPGYPSNYAENKVCIYEIIQPVGKIITLSFQHLDLENNECYYDYVEVYDGDSENSTLLEKFCTKPKSNFVSTYNFLYVKFVSDSSVNAQGFTANYSTIDVECGGIIKAETGTIKPPKISTFLDYGDTANCTWLLIAPVGKIVKVTADVINTRNCIFDYVKFYDVSNTFGKKLVKKQCSRVSEPHIIISSEHMMAIQYITEEVQLPIDFYIDYVFVQETEVCRGSYYTDYGILKSPNNNMVYYADRDCQWVIHALPGHQIMLNITKFDLETSRNCLYDWLEIRNGGSITSPLIGKYCGTDIPKMIPSLTNQIFVRFKSDSTDERGGFQIYWSSTSTGCGGTLTSPSGFFTSPQYPEPYSSNTECYWKIITNLGSVLKIVFADIELEEDENCIYDYLEIFDGIKNTKLLGTFCNQQNTHTIRSTTNEVSVKMKSDQNIEGRGFSLQYFTDCNNVVTGFNGVIESPNFPNNNPHFMNCTWKISVLTGNKINLTFSHIDLTSPFNFDNETNCSINYIQIKKLARESAYDDKETSEKICSNQELPMQYSLDSDNVEISFITNTSFTGKGFRLEWQQVGCGGVLKRPSGSFTSPGYPKPYTSNIMCKWVIEVDYGNSIEIMFDKIDIESHADCQYDYIKVYNGPDTTYPTLTAICRSSNKPKIVTSTGNFMVVEFHSDFSTEGEGFIANYSTVESKCGGKFTPGKGSFTSPNYPANYEKAEICEYSIEIDDGHRIELFFDDLDIAGDASCNESYVKVYDGPSQAYPVLKILCGNLKSKEMITSTYNHMLVEFVANSSYSAKGFKAHYRKGCGAVISTQGSGIIGNFDMWDYAERENCSWTISAEDPTQHIYLIFTKVSHLLNWVSETNKEKIYVYNGESGDDPLLGTVVNEKSIHTYASTGNSLHIEASVFFEFEASYSVFESDCGGNFNLLEGYFASPYFPNSYPPNIECEWTIEATPGASLSLSFDAFDIVDSEGCNVDFLEIRETSASGNLLAILCGNEIPPTIRTNSTLWLLFKSAKNNETGNGFKAQFSLGFVNEITGSSGSIASPLYPTFYHGTLKGQWTIIVPFGHCINLNFKDFYVECMEFEEESKITIYDGFNEDARLLYGGCLSSKPEAIQSTANALHIKSLIDPFHRSRFFFDWTDVGKCSSKLTPSKKKASECGSLSRIDLSDSFNYTLTSPGYPNGYSNNLECEWTFQTAPENHLVIIFSTIDLDNYIENCYFDKVELYDGKNGLSEWSIKNTICQRNATNKYYIFGNLLKVKFISNRYGNGSGFSASVEQACGGDIRKSSGIIQINDYWATRLNRYFSDSTICQWNVTVKTGRKIEVEVTDLNLKNHNGDCSNYIMLRNGLFPDSPLLGIGKYCEKAPEKLITSGNFLNVKFLGSYSATFSIKFRELSPNCGGEYTLSEFDKSIIINSPNYPNIPLPHTECSWVIAAPLGRILRVDFIERFDIRGSKDCEQERVEVHDGGSQHSPLIKKLCGEHPSSLFSTLNFVYIKFFTDIGDPSNGFKANVTIAECGGIVAGFVGEIKSPYYHEKKKYPVNADCVWKIKGPTHHKLNMSFFDIDLPKPNAEECYSVDHVEIKEKIITNSSDYRSLGTFCGNENPGFITSFNNEAIVTFTTSSVFKEHNGFMLAFASSTETCGGELTMEEGVITSPGYPLSLQSMIDCQWIIKVPKGRRVTLKFLDIDLSGEAHYEQGIAYSFGEGSQGEIEMLTQFNTDQVIKSSDNLLEFFFWNYQPIKMRGFKAKFTSDEPTACSSDFGQTAGNLGPPKENMTHYVCVWEHQMDTADTQKSLALYIKFELEKDNFCGVNNIVLDIKSGDDSLLELECSKLPYQGIVISPTQLTTVSVFKAILQKFNFSINYVTHNCGGIIKSPIGQITTPGFPKRVTGKLDCSWLIKLPSDESVKINFTSFETGVTCDDSHLIIYSGNSIDSPKIGKFCDQSLPTSYHIHHNEILMQYHVKDKVTSSGFSLNYELVTEGCGGIIHNPNRLIITPNYPKEYPSNTECFWEIHSDDGEHIMLEFVDRFHLEDSKNCSKDFVEILDYKDDKWESMGRFCGRNNSRVFNSTSTQMRIIFRSDNNSNAAGFRAKWTPRCGGVFKADKNIRYIVSPKYPKVYPENLNCIYEISAPKKVITLVFEDFDLEKSIDCKFDNITIENSETKPYLRGKKSVYCGTDKPKPLRRHNHVRITFRTDSSLSNKGFKLTYNIDDCGGDITSPTIIYFPKTHSFPQESYVDSLFNTAACVWNITAPSDKHVTVDFQVFELRDQTGFSFESVEIFNGTKDIPSQSMYMLYGNLTANLPIIKSPSNSMILRLKSDFSNPTSKFKAYVYFEYGPDVGCGGNVYLNETRVITPARISSVLDCHWTISAIDSVIIKIEFLELNLHGCVDREGLTTNKSDNCIPTRVEVHDGKTFNSDTIVMINTSSSELKTYYTSGTSAWIRFAGLNLPYNGFRIRLSPIPSLCGNSLLTVTNTTQTLKSPNYPNPYPENIRCKWNLKSNDIFTHITIRFLDLDFGSSGEKERCDNGKIEISESFLLRNSFGGRGSATVVSGKHNFPVYADAWAPMDPHMYCDDKSKHFEYYSGSREVTVSLVGSSKPQGRGFLLEYSLSDCSRNYTATEGQIKYQHRKIEDCWMSISTPENTTVSLYFSRFGVYDSTNCKENFLVVYDGNSTSNRQIAKLCEHTLPNPIFSTSNQLLLHLQVKRETPINFDLLYVSTENGRGCGGKFFEYAGKFTSPLYPQSYRHEITCTWYITVPEGLQIHLKFNVFDIQGPCSENNVVVQTFNKDGTSLDHKFCSEDTPAELASETTEMIVSYRKSSNVPGTGWVAQFIGVTSGRKIQW